MFSKIVLVTLASLALAQGKLMHPREKYEAEVRKITLKLIKILTHLIFGFFFAVPKEVPGCFFTSTNHHLTQDDPPPPSSPLLPPPVC